MKRLFAIILTAVLLLTLLPVAVVAADNEVTAGDFTIWATEGGTLTDSDYSFSDGLLVIKSATAVTVKNTAPGTATTNRIEVADGVNANITLAGVNIDVSGISRTAAFKIADNSTGKVTITLAEGTINTLKSGEYSAGLQKNGDAENIGALTINGTGTLEAQGGTEYGAGIGGSSGQNSRNITINGGTITANGSGGAGIGGGGDRNGSYITINGGMITAYSPNGAGIGGGDYGYGAFIFIHGGTVKATSGSGAGIGGGREGNGTDITISGGTVTASGGPGIGGGYGGSGERIIISGGSVRAIPGQYSYPIGGGGETGGGPVTPKNKADGGQDVYLLTIPNPKDDYVMMDGELYNPINHKAADSSDSNLYAYVTGTDHTIRVGGKEYKAAFDSDKKEFTLTENTKFQLEVGTDLTISPTEEGTTLRYGFDYTYEGHLLKVLSDEKVTIKNGEGITTTTDRIDVLSQNANITLAGVNIDVSNRDYTCAFTVTDQCTGTVTITLADNTVNKLSSGLEYAGLQKNSSGSLVIQGDTLGTGSLIATGGPAGAGIGGAWEGSVSNITISGGTVTAQGGESGAGIGGGWGGSGSNITISGGSVRAIAGRSANAIGGGFNGNGPVTPKNNVSDGEDVYLITIANPDSKTVTIDGTEYTPANHKAADSTDTNLYAYVTGKTHIVKIGDDETHYHFANGEFAEAVFNTAYEKNANSHWHTCTTEGCEITHPVAHSGTDDGDCTTAVTCVCGYVTTAAEEAHSFAWTPSTQDEGKHDGSCQVDGCLQTDTGDCKDENPRDHMCDTCGDELTQHTGGQATCTAQAVCSICGKGYGDLLSCKSHGYSDVGQLEWYHDDVDYVIEKGLMIGYENGTFRPCEPLTRAELVQILYNWAGKHQVEITGQFSDVEPDVWYAKAVSWAYEEGIVNGMGNGKFSPDLPITREQLATMLYRQAGEPETTGTLEGFADGDQASIYAIPALKWAVEQGILQGDQDEAGKTCLRPQDDAKRGEVAAMLHRYIG